MSSNWNDDFKKFRALYAVMVLVWLLVVASIVGVAIHFIAKFW